MAGKKPQNEEFSVNLDEMEDPSEILEEIKAQSDAEEGKVKATRAKRGAPSTEPIEKLAAGSEKVKPEQKVRIMIDEVPGMSNYEVVGCNGDVIQIKRGVPVEVEQRFINVLQDAVLTTTEVTKNPVTGEREEKKREYSAIPWRRV